MAFLTIDEANSKEGASPSNNTSHTLTWPDNLANGDRVLVVAGADGSPTFGWPASWVEVFDALGDSSLCSGAAAYFDCNGTESGTFTVTTSASERISWKALRIPGGAAAPAIEATTATSASGTSYDPPQHTLSGGASAADVLWLAFVAIDATTATTHSSYPTNYTLYQDFLAADATSIAAIALSGRELNANTENPAAGAISNNRTKLVATIAIRPAPSGTLFTATLTGSMTPSGALAKVGRLTRSGSVSSAGALGKAGRLTRTGASTPTGSLIRRSSVVRSGSVPSAGSLRQIGQKLFSGAATPSGSLGRNVSHRLVGSLTPTGTLTKLVDREAPFAGTVAPSSALVKEVRKIIGGSIWGYRERVLNDGAIAYWRLGETAGAVAEDEGPNGYTGEIKAGVTLDEPSLLNTDSDPSMLFQNVGDSRILITDNALTDGIEDQFSFEAWVIWDPDLDDLTSTLAATIAHVGGGANDWRMRISPFGSQPIEFGVYLDNAGSPMLHTALADNSLLADGEAHHLVGTFVRDTIAGIRLYVDGELAGSGNTADLPILHGGPPTPQLAIGTHSGGGSHRWGGHIDEVAVYDGVLTATEILEHYMLGAGGHGTLEAVTTRTLTLTGEVSSAGQIRQEVMKTLAGSVASAGALAKRASTTLSGAVPSAGAIANLIAKTLSGSISAAGALSSQVAKAFGGNVTPEGTKVVKPLKILTGETTPTGELSSQTGAALVLTGSIAPTGALQRSAAKSLSGVVASAGALQRLAAKLLGGEVTPTGTTTTQQIATRTLAGTISSSGSLGVTPLKLLGGSIAISGSLVKRVAKLLGGVLTPVGELIRDVVGEALPDDLSATSVVRAGRGVVAAIRGRAARGSVRPGREAEGE